MELQYEKALEQYNLSVDQVSEDAQIGIEQINSVLKGINMLQKSGKEVKDKTFKKLKAMDKWVYNEIIDQVKGTDKNEDEIPYAEQDVLEEAEDYAYADDESLKKNEDQMQSEKVEVPQIDGLNESNEIEYDEEYGYKIDEELKKAFESGKTQIKLNELKSVSPTSYIVIFDTYDETGDNGIETTNYSLIETDEELFTLTKK
jgi:hypothetical protein